MIVALVSIPGALFKILVGKKAFQCATPLWDIKCVTILRVAPQCVNYDEANERKLLFLGINVKDFIGILF